MQLAVATGDLDSSAENSRKVSRRSFCTLSFQRESTVVIGGKRINGRRSTFERERERLKSLVRRASLLRQEQKRLLAQMEKGNLQLAPFSRPFDGFLILDAFAEIHACRDAGWLFGSAETAFELFKLLAEKPFASSTIEQ